MIECLTEIKVKVLVFVLPLVILPLVSFGDTAAESKNWPMYRGGQQQLGVAQGSIPERLELLWQYETGGPILSSPVIADGTLFIGSGDDSLYALDIKTGEKIWSYATKGAIEAPPMVMGDSVYVGSTDGFLYSFRAKDGELNWTFETYDKIIGSANWFVPKGESDPLVVFGSYDGNLYAIETRSGIKRWCYESENYINGSPAVYAGQTVAGGCDAMIHCVSLADGDRISSFDVGAYIAASIAFDGQRAYVGHYNNEFICVDVSKQEIIWEYKDRNFPYFSAAAVVKDFVVFGARDRRIHCVDRNTGKRIWVFPTKGNVDSSPVVCGGDVVAGSEDGRLYRLGLSDGEEKWSYEIGAAILGSPAVADGKVYIGADNGVVYAFGEKE